MCLKARDRGFHVGKCSLYIVACIIKFATGSDPSFRDKFVHSDMLTVLKTNPDRLPVTILVQYNRVSLGCLRL